MVKVGKSSYNMKIKNHEHASEVSEALRTYHLSYIEEQV